MKEQSDSYGTRIRSKGFDYLGIRDFSPLVITAIAIFYSIRSMFAYNHLNIAFTVNLALYRAGVATIISVLQLGKQIEGD